MAKKITRAVVFRRQMACLLISTITVLTATVDLAAANNIIVKKTKGQNPCDVIQTLQGSADCLEENAPPSTCMVTIECVDKGDDQYLLNVYWDPPCGFNDSDFSCEDVPWRGGINLKCCNTEQGKEKDCYWFDFNAQGHLTGVTSYGSCTLNVGPMWP